LLAEPHLNSAKFLFDFDSVRDLLNVFYSLSLCLSLSFILSIPFFLSFLSPSLLPYLYMSRLRSLDLKFCCLASLTILPYTPRACTDEGIWRWAQCTGTQAGHTH
jgi:hypothetical protein